MSFETAVTGINSASKDLETTSNNLANAGTTGFKRSRAEFDSILAMNQMGISGNAVGQGAQLANVGQMFSQGSLEFTERSLDLGIQGGGFFRLEDGGEVTYTRAGQFQVDDNGYIVSSKNGKRLTGFQMDAEGNRVGDGRQALKLPTDGMQAQATKSVELGANLSADAKVLNQDGEGGFDPGNPDTYNHSTTTTVYDSQGKARNATHYFVKTGDNTWQVHTKVEGVEGQGENGTLGDPHELQFDKAGNLIDDEGTPYKEGTYQAALGDGVEDLDITVDFSDMTQFARPFSVNKASQDGHAAGEFQSVNIQGDGKIIARYNNGESQAVGQVALTNFRAERELEKAGETGWKATQAAGDPLIGTPDQGQFGTIESGALEQSNVETSEELVDMITAQRNFSANARMIKAQDQMTQEVLNIR